MCLHWPYFGYISVIIGSRDIINDPAYGRFRRGPCFEVNRNFEKKKFKFMMEQKSVVFYFRVMPVMSDIDDGENVYFLGTIHGTDMIDPIYATATEVGSPFGKAKWG